MSWQEELRRDNQEIADAFINDLNGAEPVLLHLTEQLSEGVRHGRWHTVVGDDIRGRFVGLAIGSVMRRYAREHQQPIPRRLFLATGRHEMGQRWIGIEAYLARIAAKLGRCVLFATEYADTGDTSVRMTEILQDQDITCDTAIAYMDSRRSQGSLVKRIEEAVPEWRGSVFVAGQSLGAPALGAYLHKAQGVTGVVKNNGPVTMSSIRQARQEAVEDNVSQEEVQSINETLLLHQQMVIIPIRRAVREMSGRIYTQVFGK